MSDAKRSVLIDGDLLAATVARAEAAGVEPSTVIEEAPRRFPRRRRHRGDLGRPARAWRRGELQLIASPALLLKLRDVLMRGKFART